MSLMFEDARFALRGLRHARRFTVTVLATVALGVGASVALYCAAEGLLFGRERGLRTPSQLVELFTSRYNGSTYGPFSYPDFASLKAQSRSFSDLAAYQERSAVTVRLNGALRSVKYTEVSETFFDVLGVSPVIGSLSLRQPTTAEHPAAVIAFDLWRTSGGVPTDTLALTLNEVDYRVVGVAPASFKGLHVGRPADVWVPLAGHGASRGHRSLRVIGRLRDGVALEEGRLELRAMAARLSADHPETNRGTQVDPAEPRRLSAAAYSPLDVAANAPASLVGSILIGATGVGLLSACVNIMSLLLGRAVARRREFAIALALGAGRARLARVVLLESLLLLVVGSMVGIGLSYWVSATLAGMLSPEQHALLASRPARSTALWVLLGSAGLGMVVGAVPALASTRFSVSRSLQLHRATDNQGSARLRLFILAAQVAVSVVILVGAVLLARGLTYAAEASSFLNPGKVALFSIEGGSGQDTASLYEAVTRGLARTNGVASVGSASTLPLGELPTRQFRCVSSRAALSEAVEAGINYVSVDYLPTLSVPVVEGRHFTYADDVPDGRAILVNEAFAQCCVGMHAAGRDVQDARGTTQRIIGVVRNEIYRTLQGSPQPTVYYPLRQSSARRLFVAVRTSTEAEHHLARLRRELTASHPRATVLAAASFQSYIANVLIEERVATLLVDACSVSALLLTLLGAYSISVEEVRRRTPEMGLRSALGAPPAEVVRRLATTGFVAVAAGACAGIAGVFVMLRLVRALVFLPALGTHTIIGATAVVLIVAMAAAVLPALRAIHVTPWTTLRTD
jgi:predicted permease